MTDKIHPQVLSMTINELRRSFDKETDPVKREQITAEIKHLCEPETMIDDIVDRLRSRAEAPNAWKRKDYFLLEVAEEIERLRRDRIEDWSAVCERQRVEIARLKAENKRLQGALLWNGKDLKEFEGS